VGKHAHIYVCTNKLGEQLKSIRFDKADIITNKLLKLRDIAKSFIKFKVGDGCQIFMWFDPWHPAGYLLDNFGFRAAYDSGISVGSKLSTIIRDGAWFWSYAPFDSIVEIQSRLPEVDIGIEDLPIWNSRNGSSSCAET
jgi:hypothetical protein